MTCPQYSLQAARVRGRPVTEMVPRTHTCSRTAGIFFFKHCWKLKISLVY